VAASQPAAALCAAHSVRLGDGEADARAARHGPPRAARRLALRAGGRACGEVTAWRVPATSMRHQGRPLDDSSRRLAAVRRSCSLGPQDRGRSDGPAGPVVARQQRSDRDAGSHGVAGMGEREQSSGSAAGCPSRDGVMSATTQGQGLTPWVRACPSAMDLYRNRCLALPGCQPTPDPASPARQVPVELDGRCAPLDSPVVARPYAEQVHTDEHDQTPRR
jgi:hypothetical protein